MNTRNDYILAIKTIATKNKKLFELSPTERENLTYLYVRENYVNICRNEYTKNALIKFYRHQTDLKITGVNIMNILHQSILNTIENDLNDELSDLAHERESYELYAIMNDINNDEKAYDFWINEDENAQLQFESDLRYCKYEM